MNYLICQDWSNTTNNHAGIKYLCNKLQENFPDRFQSITIKDYHIGLIRNRIIGVFQRFNIKYQYKKRLDDIFKYLVANFKEGDKVVLMEYYEKLYPQKRLAKKLKAWNSKLPIYAMVHLVPQKLDDSFSDAEFKNWAQYIDKFITLGSSLSLYLKKRGIDKSRIITTFHYVDKDYYHPFKVNTSKRLKVIAMGNQMRNEALLQYVIFKNKDVDFIVCQGMSDMSNVFVGCDNVKLIPFVPEDELREYMNQADISINVMVDTIGSNVIVTSMAMGLAMICSDVGSIRDYCDATNTIFCKNNDMSDWANTIHILAEDKERLAHMKKSAFEKAQTLTIENFGNSLLKLI